MLPAPDKCYQKTMYPLQTDNPIKKYVTSACVYLSKDGKCQLNGCIKNYTKLREKESEI